MDDLDYHLLAWLEAHSLQIPAELRSPVHNERHEIAPSSLSQDLGHLVEVRAAGRPTARWPASDACGLAAG